MDNVLLSSESSDHYTPRIVLDKVQLVLEDIDLDPCADPQHRVPARVHYTSEKNGLLLPWPGHIFMNPPYGRKIDKWTRRLVDQRRLGWTTSAIALLPARTDTIWFRPMYKQYICFVSGRLRFLDYRYEEQDPAPFPSAIVYFGSKPMRFAEVFSSLGAIVAPAISGVTSDTN